MKITREKMKEIGAAVSKRQELRKEIREQLSDEALAARYGVNVRTIGKLAALHREAV